MLKHGKYVYVDLNNGKYIKVRILKSRDDNSAEKYILTNYVNKNKPKNGMIIKMDNLPIEVKDKITRFFL
ncbi:conserved hypothetical protein [Sulfolobus islandicus Y.G.57.14]|jgi:hypothetical protein|uniref:DUF5622 domain-containing protein n=10 Tax=Saccharolobus islandicus TaxID=43080 RepID=M9UDG9_SACIS|nr:DUF5622 domain-containing protein [Sulfolobus islandicus]ACP35372.1 conserved hypothetical protein [Sulfolobus islandicus L.S.2.15]ACP38032.1 conserved hypothetical protein [Sulfolobus islandicus M.14.25]ACP45528.1 conserved hypothetical protein [Sulfolobus islandicus Y.G.57.14]ACP48674.1 conserved hypothetical protein [Sulfolobus islandicus Y.N.15.51]ACP55210.1 conserved hypothetical protein [Sulfolobus islandicus M.16.27]